MFVKVRAMHYSEIETFFKQLRQVRILVVGDLMLDEYLWGKTGRISPEAPVPVVDVAADDLRLGGAGNVINNLLALGCRVEVASVVGSDADGAELCTLLKARSLDTAGVIADPARQTTRKTRILASNQQMLRIDRESRTELSEDAEGRLIAFAVSALADVQVVLVSDYLKGVVTERLVQEIIAAARKQDIPVVVDPKGRDYRKYRGATLLTPNRAEAELASGVAISDAGSLKQAGRKLLDDLQLEGLVLTRSEEGMTLFTAAGDTDLPTRAREVFDVTGAGDTVLAFIGAGLAAGLDLLESVRLANLAAGVVVGKVGTSTVAPAEVLDEVRRQHPDSDLKIRGREALGEILEEKRRQGQRIVFTNGCFDLLHVGHVKYLQKARSLGDLLVLGLNSDDSIRRLKGENRPLIGEEERAHILAALDCIDYVVLFDEDTPLELISTLRPDILVKGGDYTPDAVVGKDVVESYGGRVELITFVDGKSTTNIIEKILKQFGR